MAIKSSGDDLMSDINVTPFVDVMLVLLIIFMVTAPMMTQGVDVNLPEASSGPLPSEKEQIIVTVHKDSQIYVNKFAVSMDILRDTIARRIENDPKRDVFLRADKDIPYGDVIRVMTEIKKAGVTNLGMITIPLSSKE